MQQRQLVAVLDVRRPSAFHWLGELTESTLAIAFWAALMWLPTWAATLPLPAHLQALIQPYLPYLTGWPPLIATALGTAAQCWRRPWAPVAGFALSFACHAAGLAVHSKAIGGGAALGLVVLALSWMWPLSRTSQRSTT